MLTETQTPALLIRQLSGYHVHNIPATALGRAGEGLYASILARRVVDYTEEQQLRSPTQAGYRPDLGTTHQAFALQHVIDKHGHAKKLLYLCFVDLRSAYDKVQWQLFGHSSAGLVCLGTCHSVSV